MVRDRGGVTAVAGRSDRHRAGGLRVHAQARCAARSTPMSRVWPTSDCCDVDVGVEVVIGGRVAGPITGICVPGQYFWASDAPTIDTIIGCRRTQQRRRRVIPTAVRRPRVGGHADGPTSGHVGSLLAGSLAHGSLPRVASRQLHAPNYAVLEALQRTGGNATVLELLALTDAARSRHGSCPKTRAVPLPSCARNLATTSRAWSSRWAQRTGRSAPR